MRVHLLAIGTRRPAWETEGYDEYARRLSGECTLHLVPIPAARRTRKGEPQRWLAEEGERMLTAIPGGAGVTALDERGRAHSTTELSQLLERWLGEGRDRALLVGGADGLAPACKSRAEDAWSLSPLTLPHGLVRVLVAEALYRAWSVLRNHPYHRD